MSMIPFALPWDSAGKTVYKFLDSFETVLLDMQGEPKYYGDLHPDGRFVIRQDTTDAEVEHLTFYLGKEGETLTDAWANRANLPYVEYDQLWP